MGKTRETKMVNGVPRTKGMRNSQVASAMAHNTGRMRHKADRRAKDARRIREQYGE